MLYDEQTDPPWQLIDLREVDDVKTWPNHFSKRALPTDLDPDKN